MKYNEHNIMKAKIVMILIIIKINAITNCENNNNFKTRRVLAVITSTYTNDKWLRNYINNKQLSDKQLQIWQ